MLYNHPSNLIAFHSCDKQVGLRVLNGLDELRLSENTWDWLGPGIYFWEQSPGRAIDYAIESSLKTQFNKAPIKDPCVLGSILELGHCLNLVEAESLQVLRSAHGYVKNFFLAAGKEMPKNSGNNRALDCAVIKYIHEANKEEGKKEYDTVRCAFPEGIEVYEGSAITSRLHIQVCVVNPESIKGYFLPRPIALYNPAIAS